MGTGMGAGMGTGVTGGAVTGIGPLDGLGVIQGDIGIVVQAGNGVVTNSSGELAGAVVQAGADAPGDAEADPQGDGGETGDGTVGDGTAALKSGMAFAPQVIVPADVVIPATTADVQASAASDDAMLPLQGAAAGAVGDAVGGAAAGGVAAGGGQAPVGDTGLGLPTFFPQGAGSAEGAGSPEGAGIAAGAGATKTGGQAAAGGTDIAETASQRPTQPPVQVGAATNVPETMGTATTAQGAGAPAAATAGSALSDNEIAGLTAMAARGEPSAETSAAQATARAAVQGAAPAQGSTETAQAGSATNGLPSGARAAAGAAASGTTDSMAGDAATDDAIVSMKATREAPATPQVAAAAENGDESGLTSAAKAAAAKTSAGMLRMTPICPATMAAMKP